MKFNYNKLRALRSKLFCMMNNLPIKGSYSAKRRKKAIKANLAAYSYAQCVSMLNDPGSYLKELGLMTFEMWHEETDEELSILFAESGADREMDFDRETEDLKRYDFYLENSNEDCREILSQIKAGLSALVDETVFA